MDDYIRRKSLMEIAEQQGYVTVDDIINEPAADVAPVRRGRWEKQQGIYHCSECGKAKPYDVQADIIEYFPCNYCPNCGAKMDLEV